jgi:ribosomal protein L44E
LSAIQDSEQRLDRKLAEFKTDVRQLRRQSIGFGSISRTLIRRKRTKSRRASTSK